MAIVPAEGMAQEVGIAAYLVAYRRSRALFEDVMEPQAMTGDAGEVRVTLINRLTARESVADFFGMALGKGETLSLLLDARYRLAGGRIVAIRIAARGNATWRFPHRNT
ncbi:hypothetical protein [Caenibius sp. WL]|uniref:hypothetical protein n=1 Tax=Caenibius sp. WL TaxID=2872646 RepID=UPI001C996C76|nr:hypothetical protein [Caenibius sp. WL]QZP08052.1 hypothetical protein K5X80_15665 [Caenibius sp. WL]